MRKKLIIFQHKELFTILDEINENFEFESSRLIASPINETNELGGAKSFFLDISLSTTRANLSPVIDFFLLENNDIWGADDDTDIEYMYQYLHLVNNASILSGEQIRDGWLKHIKEEEENYIWVSNQTAFDLMQKGIMPPATSLPENNPHYEMIDAQLTTEIFGLFSPTKPKIALDLSYLPIRTTARENAADISEFYVIMHSLASKKTSHKTIKDKIFWMAKTARLHLSDKKYPAKMFDFVYEKYLNKIPNQNFHLLFLFLIFK